MTNKICKKAFTLAELAVVLIIVALILGMVVKGKKSVSASKLAAARTLSKLSPVPEIEDLLLWLDATAKNAFDVDDAMDGNAVDNWHDMSKQRITSNNASQGACADVPTYSENALNHLPMLTFDGVNDCLLGGPLGISGTGATTIFIVFRNTGTALDSGVFSFGDDDAPTSGLGKRLDVRTQANGSGWRFNNGNNLFNEDIIQNIFYISTWINSDGDSYDDHERRLNGIASTQASFSDNTANVEDEAYNIGIGRNDTGALAYEFQGDIGEIIVYGRRLTIYEIEDVEAYLSKKWNIDI